MVDHILIVGPGRSGTTLLVKLMRAYENVCVLDESRDSEVSIIAPSGDGRAVPLADMGLIRNPDVVTVTKCPREAFRLEQVYAALAPARLGVLFCTRDYRDVLVSKHEGYRQQNYWVQWPRCEAFESVWRQYRGKPDVLEIGYDELVTEPDKTQKKISESFGLGVDQAFSSYWEGAVKGGTFESRTEGALRGVRPISASSIGRWRAPENRERLLKCLDRHPEIPFCLFEWGYTRDFDWVKEIRG